MSCLPSRIPSLAWDLFLTNDAPLFLPRQQSQSTIPMDIPFFQAGGIRLNRASGTSLSPRRPQPPRTQPPSQRLCQPSRHHHCLLSHHPLSTCIPCQLQCLLRFPVIHILAMESLPPALPGLPAQSTTSMVQPRLLPLHPELQVLPSIHKALISPALGP
jgi:hypothetical protein